MCVLNTIKLLSKTLLFNNVGYLVQIVKAFRHLNSYIQRDSDHALLVSSQSFKK